MLLYLINNTVDMLRRGQVAPYASAVVEALRPAVDEISFFSKFSDVALELNVWVWSELYTTCDKGIPFTR